MSSDGSCGGDGSNQRLLTYSRRSYLQVVIGKCSAKQGVVADVGVVHVGQRNVALAPG